MKTPKHTPGPWTIVYATADGTTIRVRDADSLKGYLGKFEATIISEDGRVNWKQARLIACAPELLEIAKAYRNLLKTMAHTDGEIATYQHINETIAKATGGSNE